MRDRRLESVQSIEPRPPVQDGRGRTPNIVRFLVPIALPSRPRRMTPFSRQLPS